MKQWKLPGGKKSTKEETWFTIFISSNTMYIGTYLPKFYTVDLILPVEYLESKVYTETYLMHDLVSRVQ